MAMRNNHICGLSLQAVSYTSASRFPTPNMTCKNRLCICCLETESKYAFWFKICFGP